MHLFSKRSTMEQWRCNWKRSNVQYACPQLLPPHLHIVLTTSHEHKMPMSTDYPWKQGADKNKVPMNRGCSMGPGCPMSTGYNDHRVPANIGFYECRILHEHRVPVITEPMGDKWDSKWVQDKYVTSMIEWIEGMIILVSHAFYSNQNLLWTQKEGSGVLRNTKCPRIWLLYLPALANHLGWKWKHSSKRWQLIVPYCFHLPFLWVSQWYRV